MSLAVRHWCWLLALIALTGCGAPPKKDTFYRLPEPAAESPPSAAHGGPLIQVPPFSANGLVSERALVHARADGVTLEQYNYHFWVDSPRLMLQEALSAALASSLDARVVAEAVAGAHSVRGRIERLERAGGAAAVARVALAFEVHAPHGGPALFTRRYAREVEPADDSIAACAAALGRASQDMLAEFATELARQWETITATGE